MVEQVIRTSLFVTYTYARLDAIHQDLARCEGMIVNADYGEPCTLLMVIARGQVEAFMARWQLASTAVTWIS